MGLLRCFAPALVWFALGAAEVRAADVAAIIRDADQARSGAESGMSWQVTLATHDGSDVTTTEYAVKTTATDVLVETVAPVRNKGEVMIFNDNVLWFFRPGLRKPVSISSRQRLSGPASNGDIANTHYARDYDATIAGEDAVNGQPCYRLDLKAKVKSTTYDRITYWVAKQDHLALKAEFLTLEGEPLKTAEFVYGEPIVVKGGKSPFIRTMVIVDAKNKTQKSVLTYASPKAEEHAASIFNVNNLAR